MLLKQTSSSSAVFHFILKLVLHCSHWLPSGWNQSTQEVQSLPNKTYLLIDPWVWSKTSWPTHRLVSYLQCQYFGPPVALPQFCSASFHRYYHRHTCRNTIFNVAPNMRLIAIETLENLLWFCLILLLSLDFRLQLVYNSYIIGFSGSHTLGEKILFWNCCLETYKLFF